MHFIRYIPKVLVDFKDERAIALGSQDLKEISNGIFLKRLDEFVNAVAVEMQKQRKNGGWQNKLSVHY